MSWMISRAMLEAYENSLSSPERVEAFSEANCSDGEPCAPLNGSPMPQAYLPPDRTTATWSLSRYGMTCGPLTEDRGAALLTWYREVFLARTLARREKAPALKAAAPGTGEKWPASLAKYDPARCGWKTAQLSLLEGSEQFLVTWPRSGLMRNGTCWELPTLAPAIGESESGFVPTVLTSEATGPGLHGNGSHNFRTWFRENSTERRSPLHGEIMMLWPEGWANLGAPLETAKFQQWLQQHGAS
jgi:hypothetical protein